MVGKREGTGAGLDVWKDEIARLAVDVPARDVEAIFRLPIDRVFVMKGFGAVITGTLIAGKIRKEEEVEIFPSRQRGRIRGVQVHGAASEAASAGQRTALNLAGVQTEELARGMTLVSPGEFEPTQRIAVQLSLLKDAKPLKNRARVHLHAFTSETIAEVALYGATEVKPGATAFAQLRAAEPLLLLPGVRVILRQFSPVVTIGGAVVLDSFPLLRQKKDTLLASLNVFANGSRMEALLARITRQGHDGLTLAAAVREMGVKEFVLKPLIANLLQQKQIIQTADRVIAAEAFSKTRQSIITALDTFHKANPLVAGISKEELREKLRLSQAVLEAVLAQLVAEKKTEINGEQVRLAGRGVELKDDAAQAKTHIEKAFSDARLKVPLMKEVLAKLPVDSARAHKLVTLLLRDRVLIKLADDLVFHQSALPGLPHTISQYKPTPPNIPTDKFK